MRQYLLVHILIIIALLLPCYLRAHPSGYIFASGDEQGHINLSISVYTSYQDTTWTEVVLLRSMSGTCGNDIIAGGPWALPFYPPYYEISVEDQVAVVGVTYSYRLQARKPDGSTTHLLGQPYDFVATGTSIFSRGTIEFNPYGMPFVKFVPCEEGCWQGCFRAFESDEVVDFIGEELAYQYLNDNTVINIYGQIHISDMLPTCSVSVLDVKTHSNDCGPLNNESSSWSSIKGGYR